MADSSSSSSTDTLPWAKKRKVQARIARLNAARLAKQAEATVSTSPVEGPAASSPSTETPTSTSTIPHDEDHTEDSASSDSEMEVEEEFTEEKAQEIFDDFVVALPRDVRRMMAVILMESFKKRQKMRVVDAAREAGSITGYNERTFENTERNSLPTKEN